MLFVSVDTEASGPVPGLYNLVSIGAVAVRGEPGGRFAIDETEPFYVELEPVFPGFVEEAMAVHGISKEYLTKHGADPKEAMASLRSWVLERAESEEKPPVFVGHNVGFDWSYINYYFHYSKVANPFDIFSLDTKSLAFGRFELPWGKARKSVFQILFPGIGTMDKNQQHRADYDAIYQARMFCELMNAGCGRMEVPDGIKDD